MAIQGPTYNQSAVDILSPMLTITQHMRENRASKGDKLYKGAGDLASGLAGWQAMEKRKATFVEYVGDEALTGMEQKLEELIARKNEIEARLQNLRNSMYITKPMTNFDETVIPFHPNPDNRYDGIESLEVKDYEFS